MKQVLLLIAGLLMMSLDGGAQMSYWHIVPSGTGKNLTGISFGSPQVGYISGVDSLLLRTVDGGLTWSRVLHSGMAFSFVTPDIIHVNFTSAATGYAIVSNLANPVYKGTLYRTNDSGKTWQAVNAGNIAMSHTFFFDANNGFGIGSAFFAGNTIVKQTSGSWGTEKQFSFNPFEFLYGIDFRNASTGIVGGYGGLVYRTFNGGATWDTVQTATDSNVNALKFLSDHTILGATDNDGGAIIISHDTGRTWHLDMNTLTFAYPDIKGLAVSKRDSFIAVGHGQFPSSGIILWYQGAMAYNYMTTQRLNAVAMHNDSIAYIVGDSGMILTNRQTLGINEQGANNAGFTLYPVPASGYCYTEAPYVHTVRIYDAAGRLVIVQSQPSIKHTIPLQGLCPGIYVLRSHSESGTQTYRKLVVE